jgi:predicted membrane protein
MSIRNVHLLFITLSVVLAVLAAVWAADRYRDGGDLTYAVAGLAALGAAGGLAAYGVAFRRKSRHW